MRTKKQIEERIESLMKKAYSNIPCGKNRIGYVRNVKGILVEENYICCMQQLCSKCKVKLYRSVPRRLAKELVWVIE